MMLIAFILIIVFMYVLIKDDSVCECLTMNDTIQCSNCGGDIKQDYNYCPTCKEKLKKECPNCGNMINMNWRNCPYCQQI